MARKLRKDWGKGMAERDSRQGSLLPVFPQIGSSRAELLDYLWTHESLTVKSDQQCLQIYDLESRGWPLMHVFVDFNTTEVSLDRSRLPVRVKKILKLFLEEHRTKILVSNDRRHRAA